MADRRTWPALVLAADLPSRDSEPGVADFIAATLDDFAPVAIQDLADVPLPRGGLWDPRFTAASEAPDSALQWRVFFSTSEARDRAATALAARYPALSLAVEEVADEDWAARSQRQVTAVRAGSFVVAPPWDVPAAVAPGETLIVIEPSRGFGTGHHASTRLCLRALSTIDVKDRSVLDLGTGSGVLALAAALSGARSVMAIDIDADAVDAARASAALNPGGDAIHWRRGDYRAAEWPPSANRWEIVLANLTGGALTSSAARVRDLVAADGVLITSGFDESERAGVEDSLQMTTRLAIAEDGWVGLALVPR